MSFLLRPKQPKSARSNAPDASYGVSIPRVLGKIKLPGNLVLATFPRWVGPKGKGGLMGGGASKTDKFFGTCQVLVGEGNLHNIHGNNSTAAQETLPINQTNQAVAYLHTGLDPSVDVATLSVVNLYAGLTPNVGVAAFSLPIGAPFSFSGSVALEANLQLQSLLTNEKRNLVISVFPDDWKGKVGATSVIGVLGESTVILRRSNTTNGTGSGSNIRLVVKQGGNLYLGYNPGTITSLTTGTSGVYITDTVDNAVTITTNFFGKIGTTSSTALTNPDFSINPDLNQSFDVGFAYVNLGDDYYLLPNQPFKLGFALLFPYLPTTTPTKFALNTTNTIDGRLYLNKIYVNDKVWYSKDDSTTSSTTQYFEFFDGRQNQSKSITLSAILGASKTPEYSGISHIVFKDLPLHDFGGDNYPTFHFEVDTKLSLTPYLLIKDLMYRCGVYFNRQLTEGQHYLTTPQFRAISSLSNLLGFQIDQQGSTPRDYVDQVTQLYDFSYYQVNQNPVNGLKSLLFEKNYDFSGGVSSDTGVIVDLERKELNSSQDRQAVPVYEMSSDSRKIASSVEVKALNFNNNYENIAISLNQFTGDSNGEIVSISYALATDSADLLRLLAQRALVKSAHGSVEVTHTDARYQTQVQDVLNVQNTNLPLMRTKRISIGANGIVQTERYAIAEGAVNTSGLLPQPNTNNNDPLPDTKYITSWFEGQRQTSLLNDILGQRVTHVIISSTSKEGLSDAGTLVYSVDGGSTSVSTGQTVSPNSLYCSIALTTTTFTGTTVIDAVSVLDITVPSRTTLNSINDPELFTGTQNLLMIPGLGLISFGLATLTGVNTYRLSRLLWNVGQTLWDSNTKTQSNYSGFCYLMTSQFHSIPVPSTVPPGAALRYFVGQTTGTLDSSAIAPLRNNPEVLDGLCDYPRHVTGVLFSLQDTGDLQVDWYAPQSQAIFQPSPLFDAAMTDAVSYTTRLRNGAGTVLVTHSGLTGLTDTFTSAEIAGNTGLNVTIQAQNSMGQFMPETNLVKWVA